MRNWENKFLIFSILICNVKVIWPYRGMFYEEDTNKRMEPLILFVKLFAIR